MLKCLVVTFSSVIGNYMVFKNVLTPKGTFWEIEKYQHGSSKYSSLNFKELYHMQLSYFKIQGHIRTLLKYEMQYEI